MSGSRASSTRYGQERDRDSWGQQILRELTRAQQEGNGRPHLVWLGELGVSMLGSSDSQVGLEWLEALHDLQRRGLIAIDSAGYVTLR